MADSRLSFVELMALDAVGPGRYMSKSPAWAPGGQGRSYGGHVYAQAVWAAAQTVGTGMTVHVSHGFFTLGGQIDRPYVYSVEKISEGRSYCTRSVTVRQPLSPSSASSPLPVSRKPAQFHTSDGSKDLGEICFKSICSFKKDEFTEWGHQEEKDVSSVYKKVLDGFRPEDHAGEWKVVMRDRYLTYAEEYPRPEDFPGLDMRKVNMDKYNNGKPIIDYRQLTLYRLLGKIPEGQTNLHACAHLFASDRNSLFLISNALGFPDNVEKMGSLSHSVVFHVDSKKLLLRESGDGDDDEDDAARAWFTQEAWTPQSGGGRGVHESKIWDSAGLHIASSWQDGLVRRAETGEGKQKLLWMAPSSKL